MPRLADIVNVLDGWYDSRWAASWDAVGLVCGDPGEPVERILLAVDAVPSTVGEAVSRRSQLLITHHPLFLTAVHGVPASDPKGALVHRMIQGGVAHFVAHTNADAADPGVSDALADRIGLRDLRPLEAQDDEPPDKLVVFVPVDSAEPLIDALAAAGAGTIGAYERCAWTTDGVGTFRPQAGAEPTIGHVGAVEHVPEVRVEMVVPRGRRGDVVSALRGAHPYEEPAFDLLTQSPVPGRRGSGRIGELAGPMTLRELTAHVAAALPPTVWGVRAAGNPDRTVQTVAVCGGSGGSLVDVARRAGADAFLTSDLRHHPVSEAVTEHGENTMALLDAAHWATESPWLEVVAARLREHFGTTVEVRVSTRVTDPWTLHAPSPESSQNST